jgi:hypothetical protein
METKTTSVPPRDQVTHWRYERLVESGFTAALAATVARNADYDLHAVIELVERGCEPELAVRILAPIDQERAA